MLQVHEDAIPEIINKAYRTLARKYHPDVSKDNVCDAESKMKELNEAYGILSNIDKRSKYDAEYSAIKKSSQTNINNNGVKKKAQNDSNESSTQSAEYYEKRFSQLINICTQINRNAQNKVIKDDVSNEANRKLAEDLEQYYQLHGRPIYREILENGSLCYHLFDKSMQTVGKTFYQIAIVLSWANSFDEAIRLIKTSLQMSPDYAEAAEMNVALCSMQKSKESLERKAQQAYFEEKMTCPQCKSSKDTKMLDGELGCFNCGSGIEKKFIDLNAAVNNAKADYKVSSSKCLWQMSIFLILITLAVITYMEVTGEFDLIVNGQNTIAMVDRSYLEKSRRRNSSNITETPRHIIIYDGYQKAVTLSQLYPDGSKLPVLYAKNHPDVVKVLIDEKGVSNFRLYSFIVTILVLILIWCAECWDTYWALRKAKKKLQGFTLVTARR